MREISIRCIWRRNTSTVRWILNVTVCHLSSISLNQIRGPWWNFKSPASARSDYPSITLCKFSPVYGCKFNGLMSLQRRAERLFIILTFSDISVGNAFLFNCWKLSENWEEKHFSIMTFDISLRIKSFIFLFIQVKSTLSIASLSYRRNPWFISARDI